MLTSIQGLRAIAAWLVVGHHFSQLYLPADTTGRLAGLFHEYGAIGVDLFFAISGFVVFISIQKKTPTVRAFTVNRLVRILPAYWLFTTLTAVVVGLYPGAIPLTSVEGLFLVKSLLFIPTQNPAGIGLYPLMTVGWTLNYEVIFYLILSGSLYLRGGYQIAAIAAGICGLQVIGMIFPIQLSYYNNEIMYEFILGIIAALIYQQGLLTRITSMAACTMIIGAALFIFSNGQVEHTIIKNGLPCAIILCGCISLENRLGTNGVISKLGDWSYSTYLSHVLVISLVLAISRHWPMPDYAACAIVIILTVAASYASFRMLEKPAMRFCKKRLMSKADQ